MAESGSRALTTTLFVVLAAVGAFTASAVAGFWGGEPAETGSRLLLPGSESASEVRVEVLNGAGRTGMARDATHRLRGVGFDVVYFGNAAHFDHSESVVVDRVGDADRARAVAAALGIDSVRTAVDSALMLEVTVVLGDDWPPPQAPDVGLLDRILQILQPTDSTPEPGVPSDSTASEN